MAEDGNDWWMGAIGPGWVQRPGDEIIFVRHTDWPDGSFVDETTRIYPDGSSMWIKTRTAESPDPDHPGNTDRDITTTYTRHAADGEVQGTSSDATSENLGANHNGKTWTRTITDERGQETSQRGVTYDGRHGGSEVVKTDRTDGSTRQDTVTWSAASPDGTRVTVNVDADGTLTTTQDAVIRNDDGNWEHDPAQSEDDGPGDQPADTADDGDGVSDGEGGGEDGGGGDFGPGGPDGGASGVGDDGGSDDDDGDVGDDGPGPPIPPGPPPHPVE
jgi:hypothetical protein